MQIIDLNDKSFGLYISKTKICAAIKRISDKINIDYVDKNPLFIIILNGAFMFASDLLKMINIACDISFVKYTSYKGMKSTGKLKKLLGLGEEICGRNIVIIEDIVDRGITMENLLNDINAKKPADIKIAVMFFKQEAFEKNFKIDYIGFNIINDFIVGYGLDYNGKGRNYPEVYKLIK